MIKAIACAAVIAAVTLFAYFRGWLPIQSKAGAATQEQNHDSQPQSATSGADPSPSPPPPIQPPVKEPPKGALAVFEFGDYEAAIPRLTEELAKDKGVAPLWAALATSYEKVGKMSEAVVAWNKLAENCPKAPERSVALTRMYLASEGSARVDAGMRLLREAGESTEGAAHAVAIADLADKNGRQVEAWEAVSLAVQLGAGNEAALVARCVAYADALAFSPRDVPELGTVYVVKSGDLVVNIAKRHKVDSGTISRVNKIQNGMIRPGQRLKILTAKPELEVSIKKLTLRLWLNGKLARQYAICSGHLADSPTPIGDFTLSTKLVNPEWTRPGQQAVPFGHPDNPLGTRWMGFAEAGYTSYGVHGTIKPETIGTHASNGCVRMKNESVEELFDLVPSGTKIHIHE
jgi:lipoprotein-anchoring transpeptidase ErfK/SrfK